MVTPLDIDHNQLCKAVLAWTGYGTASYPRRDDNALTNLFTASECATLLPMVKSLEDDFYQSTAYQTVRGLHEMGEAAANEFKTRHPALLEAIADAFAWCYTFDYR